MADNKSIVTNISSRCKEAVEAYQNFVLSNFEIIQYVESLVRTVLFMTPGRYRDSELKVEAGIFLRNIALRTKYKTLLQLNV